MVTVRGQHRLPPQKAANDYSRQDLGRQILDVLKQVMGCPLQQFVNAVQWHDTVYEYCGLS